MILWLLALKEASREVKKMTLKRGQTSQRKVAPFAYFISLGGSFDRWLDAQLKTEMLFYFNHLSSRPISVPCRHLSMFNAHIGQISFLEREDRNCSEDSRERKIIPYAFFRSRWLRPPMCFHGNG